MKKKFKTIIYCLFFTISFCPSAYAFKDLSHKSITNLVFSYSVLSDSSIQKKIGISISDSLDGRTLDEWLGKGAIEEDNYLRPLNHFHNPLKSWPVAGLNDLMSGESSSVWAQDYKNEFSWKAARDSFYYALTSQSKSARDSHFAGMFKSLGQVMHLVQDCASPAHVRNDAHPLSDSFEKWANYNTGISLVVFPAVDTSVAPYGFDPITRFFDTGQYNGSNPSVYTDQKLGIEKE